MPQATAKIKFVKSSPQKMALLCKPIINQRLDDALWIINNSQKSYKKYFVHALTNAAAMLKDKGVVSQNDIWVTGACVNQASRLKRFRPGSRGYSYTYRHNLSHLSIMLSDEKPKDVRTPLRPPGSAGQAEKRKDVKAEKHKDKNLKI